MPGHGRPRQPEENRGRWKVAAENLISWPAGVLCWAVAADRKHPETQQEASVSPESQGPFHRTTFIFPSWGLEFPSGFQRVWQRQKKSLQKGSRSAACDKIVFISQTDRQTDSNENRRENKNSLWWFSVVHVKHEEQRLCTSESGHLSVVWV